MHAGVRDAPHPWSIHPIPGRELERELLGCFAAVAPVAVASEDRLAMGRRGGTVGAAVGLIMAAMEDALFRFPWSITLGVSAFFELRLL